MREDFYKDLTVEDISKYISQEHQDIGKDFKVVETGESSIACGYKRFDIKNSKKISFIFEAYNYFYFFGCHVYKNNTDWVIFMSNKAGYEYVKGYEEWMNKEHEKRSSDIKKKYKDESEMLRELEVENEYYEHQGIVLKHLKNLYLKKD